MEGSFLLFPDQKLDEKQIKESHERNNVATLGFSLFGSKEFVETLGTDAFPDAYATAFTKMFQPLSTAEQGRLVR